MLCGRPKAISLTYNPYRVYFCDQFDLYHMDFEELVKTVMLAKVESIIFAVNNYWEGRDSNGPMNMSAYFRIKG